VTVATQPTQLFVDGAWIDASSDQTLDVENPATGRTIATMSCASSADVDAAVLAARRALDEGPWASMTGFARRSVLLDFAREVRAAAAQLGELACDDMGMPVALTTGSAAVGADYLEYYAGWADKIGGETIPTAVPGAFDYTIRHPVGVVAAIVPWNAPIFLSIAKLAPALAAGCTVVLKPSELAPLSPIELVHCAERAGLPPGVLNLVTGPGDVVGAALVEHPGVDKVSFTGGTELGRIVGAAAAKTFKRVSLELGGKSANIVFADADLDAATSGAVMGVLINTGQQCIAGSRVLVQRPVYDEMVERISATASAIPVGMPRSGSTVCGPLISDRHLQRVLGYVHDAASSGRVTLGGERLGGELADGHFLSATVVADVDPASKLAREEVFGPVIAVIPFDTAKEAVAIANDTEFGLAGGIWTRNLDTAHGVAAALRTGTIWINNYLAIQASTPFGGHKASGLGREGGWAAIEDFTELTNVLVALKPLE
jgi:acyl-CoA reductase-like NAD-dependent aldehyde dehydrogenase